MDLLLVVLFSIGMGALITVLEIKKKCNPFHNWSEEFGTDVMVCMDCGEIVK